MAPDLRLPDAFSPEGALARLVDGFEDRPGQVAMARLVERAMDQGAVALIEAGTGTGKTLAYLVPALAWALAHDDRVVVSTYTLNLQDQILSREAPLLEEAFDHQGTVAVVKGWSNYLCLRKLEVEMMGGGLEIGDGSGHGEIAAIAAWAGATAEGERSALDQEVSAGAWERVAAESGACTKAKCPHFARCFFFAARKKAEAARILVVNHALLLLDWSLRRDDPDTMAGVLPPYTVAVIDEAHHIEAVATDFLGASVTVTGFARPLNALHRREGGGEKGLLAALWSGAGAASLAPVEVAGLRRRVSEGPVAGVQHLERAVTAFFTALDRWTRDVSDGDEGRVRLTDAVVPQDAWVEVAEAGSLVAEGCRKLSDQLGLVITELEALESEVWLEASNIAADLSARRAEVARLSRDLTRCLGVDDPASVYWAEPARSTSPAKLAMAPLNISDALSPYFDGLHAAVLTSATLAVGERFDFVRDRLGVGRLPAERRLEQVVASPFDFQEQVLLGIPTNLPPPDDPTFLDHSLAFVSELLLMTQGRTFLLFTSHRMLEAAARRLAADPALAEMEWLVQGERPRHQLLERFRQGGQCVLLGTDSFWEGVDVPGEDLTAVVLMRLPFQVPTDPVIQARVEALAQEGRSGFRDYQLPKAVLKLKQGFGRLIRRRTDRGIVLILDSRIRTKSYGHAFLKALPPAHVITGTTNRVLANIQAFLLKSAPSTDS